MDHINELLSQGFQILPNVITRSGKFSSSEKIIIAGLYSLLWNEGEWRNHCNPTNAELSHLCGVSEKTIKRFKAKAQTENLFRIHPRGNKPDVWELLPIPEHITTGQQSPVENHEILQQSTKDLKTHSSIPNLFHLSSIKQLFVERFIKNYESVYNHPYTFQNHEIAAIQQTPENTIITILPYLDLWNSFLQSESNHQRFKQTDGSINRFFNPAVYNQFYRYSTALEQSIINALKKTKSLPHEYPDIFFVLKKRIAEEHIPHSFIHSVLQAHKLTEYTEPLCS